MHFKLIKIYIYTLLGDVSIYFERSKSFCTFAWCREVCVEWHIVDGRFKDKKKLLIKKNMLKLLPDALLIVTSNG